MWRARRPTMVELTQSPRRDAWRHLRTPWTLVAVIPLIVALLDPGQALPVVRFALAALAGTLPFILVAVLMIACLKASGAEALIARAFDGREGRASGRPLRSAQQKLGGADEGGVEAQVQLLVQQATDELRLMAMPPSWRPWL